MILNLRKIGGNTLSILTSDVMNRAASFVLYALIARHLGAFEFGQLSLAISLFYMFQVFALLGLKTLIIRQVAKDRAQTKLYFGTGILIVAFSSCASLAVQFAFVRLMHYPASTTVVILVFSLGLVPYAVSAVCEAIFQAWEQMRLIAWVNVPVNLAKIAAVFLLLSRSRGLYTVILIVVASYFVIAGIETWIVLRRFAVQSASLSLQFSWSTLRSALTFLGIDGAIAIETSLNIIFLSKLTGETQVGLYSSAAQLMIPLLLVYQSIAQSTFPMMCRKVEPGFRSLKQISLQVIELLLVLSLPTIAAILFLGDWALLLFYKKQAFLQAVPVLRIVAWMLIPQVFSSVLGQTLLASHREKIILRIVIVGALTNLVVGWPLIKLFGLRGAAIALLVTKTVGSIQHYVPVSRLFSGIPIARIIWRPVVAAACMAAYLAVPIGQRGILRGVSAILVYIAALATVVIWTSGGLRQFRDKYSPFFSARSVPE